MLCKGAAGEGTVQYIFKKDHTLNNDFATAGQGKDRRSYCSHTYIFVVEARFDVG